MCCPHGRRFKHEQFDNLGENHYTQYYPVCRPHVPPVINRISTFHCSDDRCPYRPWTDWKIRRTCEKTTIRVQPTDIFPLFRILMYTLPVANHHRNILWLRLDLKLKSKTLVDLYSRSTSHVSVHLVIIDVWAGIINRIESTTKLRNDKPSVIVWI